MRSTIYMIKKKKHKTTKYKYAVQNVIYFVSDTSVMQIMRIENTIRKVKQFKNSCHKKKTKKIQET